MSKFFSYCIFIFFVLSACYRADTQSNFTLSASKEQFILNMQYSVFINHSSQLGYWSDTSDISEHIYIFNENNAVMNHYVLNKSNVVDENYYDISLIFPTTQRIPEGFTIINKDSILFLSGTENELCLSNAHFKPLFRWRLKKYIRPFGVYLYTALQPLAYRNGYVYTLLAPKIGATIYEKTKLNQAFSVPNGAITRINDSTYLRNDVGNFPRFLSGDHSYNISYATFCVSKTGTAVYSFGAFPELYAYHADGSRDKVIVRSRYHQPPQEFPFEKYTDYRYLREYKLRNSEYGNIFYDPYRHFYLRVYEHGTVGRGGATPIDDFSKKPWSLMILDDDLNVLNEIKFSYTYNPKSILVTRRGILISPTRPGLTSYRPKQIPFQLFVYKQVKQL